MAIEINVPRLGWSMEEGTFAGWAKKDGETVKPGEPLFILEGEKALEEVESLDSGVLYVPPDAPKSGDRVVVGQRLGYLLAPGEGAPPASSTTAVPPALGERRPWSLALIAGVEDGVWEGGAD
jgi:pyruvate dehydrogenase E2 component (dihydrolipoamide acetyltransferase)